VPYGHTLCDAVAVKLIAWGGANNTKLGRAATFDSEDVVDQQ